ncbi:MAG: hypothetical protein B7Z67_02225 [Acidiphilium sp. 21-60-14]|nr:MAG: hypothetical protein B7Z67_02225 [Acidiphilium sp. 21-60-14]OYV92105.1 MAG: hypothetical protein B7Z57_02080 [Acidiphilium sp. 37-60-79]OZB40239.1 MAG: hypothetical protein B7X48_05900 [Acidiphilium sp. 34-60-192]
MALNQHVKGPILMRFDAYIRHNQPARCSPLAPIPVFAPRSARQCLTGFAIVLPDYRLFPITLSLTSGS